MPSDSGTIAVDPEPCCDSLAAMLLCEDGATSGTEWAEDLHENDMDFVDAEPEAAPADEPTVQELGPNHRTSEGPDWAPRRRSMDLRKAVLLRCAASRLQIDLLCIEEASDFMAVNFPDLAPAQSAVRSASTRKFHALELPCAGMTRATLQGTRLSGPAEEQCAPFDPNVL
ncbi:unnamed protein product [Pedinophyceae sp. YPF-701]|nr:unnamed protein product [Pedinophyceae sp. YPF-701]